MKLYKLSCPNCNGNLDMEVKDDTHSIFCPYCGQNFHLDDDNKEYIININKNIKKNYTNEAELLKAKIKEKEDKRSWIALGVIFAFLIIIISVPNLIFYFQEQIAINDGKICAGSYSDLVGEDYKTVEAHFESAGFTNIELIDLNDSGVTFWNNEKVESISVGGNTRFNSSDYFEPDTKVVISYH